METITKQAELLLQSLGIHFSDVVVFVHDGFQVCVVKINITNTIRLDDSNEIQHAIAHLLREITHYEDLPIIVDINGSEIKKLERLQQTIHILSERARLFDKKFEFSDLSSFERMLVHGYVSRLLPEFITESSGEGKDRRIAIFLKAI